MQGNPSRVARALRRGRPSSPAWLWREEAERLVVLSRDVLCVLDASGRVQKANPALTRILGYAVADLDGRTLHELVHRIDAGVVRRAFEQLAAGAEEVSFECRVRASDGTYRWLAWRASGSGERSPVYAVARDTTEHQRLERARRETEERFRGAIDGSLDAVMLLTSVRDGTGVVRDFEIAELNARAERMLDRAGRDVRGTSLFDLAPSLRTLGLFERYAQVLESGEPLEEEIELDGIALRARWIHQQVVPVGDGLAVTVRDVSGRREMEAELRRGAAELARSNEELQQFANVASHDLQEPLRKILAFGSRIGTRAGAALGADERDYLQRMLGAADRMQTLIDGLLAFARVSSQTRPFIAVDLGRIAREVVSDLEGRLEETGGEVLVGALPSVDADPLQMRQLLQNLIGNALKFHRAGERPQVVVRARSASPRDGRAMSEIVVQDHGIGFDERFADRLFAPFQRLHGRGEYEGSGMGLAICRRIVERHGGTIGARSRPGEGASFVVTLPAATVPPGADGRSAG